MIEITVVSTIPSGIFPQKALELGAKLGLPVAANPAQCRTPLLLAYTAEGLQLLHRPSPKKKPLPLLAIDFVGGKNGYRLLHERTIRQPLARATGIRPGCRPTILDATAGLGGDALVLASLGCQVTMCERSPLLAALLDDALSRARQASALAAEATSRLTLLAVDARHHLAAAEATYQTIYLDPMYPQRSQSALNRQTMRAIRDLVGDDDDSGQLLELARRAATERVTVKRPQPSPHLGEAKPSHAIFMKNSRFDVYLAVDRRFSTTCDTSPPP